MLIPISVEELSHRRLVFVSGSFGSRASERSLARGREAGWCARCLLALPGAKGWALAATGGAAHGVGGELGLLSLKHRYGVFDRSKTIPVGGAEAPYMAEAATVVADKFNSESVISINHIGSVKLAVDTTLVCSGSTLIRKKEPPISGSNGTTQVGSGVAAISEAGQGLRWGARARNVRVSHSHKTTLIGWCLGR